MKIYIPMYLTVAGQKPVTVYVPAETAGWTDRQIRQFNDLTYRLTIQKSDPQTVSNAVIEFVSNLPGSTVVIH